MKKTPLLLALTLPFLFFLAGCEKDPYPLDVEQFDVFRYDGDNSGTNTPNDELDFNVKINTTAPEPDDQYITDWELSYSANGQYVAVLQSDQGKRINSLSFTGTVVIKNLALPWSGGLLPGDKLEFRFWAVDNRGTSVERFYLFELE